jgi:hypothetical protein
MYLNLVQIAESFGVSEKVVEDWIRIEGLPHVPDRGRLLFDRARVAHWAAAHGLTARAGFLTPEKGAFTTGLALEPMLRRGGSGARWSPRVRSRSSNGHRRFAAGAADRAGVAGPTTAGGGRRELGAGGRRGGAAAFQHSDRWGGTRGDRAGAVAGWLPLAEPAGRRACRSRDCSFSCRLRPGRISTRWAGSAGRSPKDHSGRCWSGMRRMRRFFGRWRRWTRPAWRIQGRGIPTSSLALRGFCHVDEHAIIEFLVRLAVWLLLAPLLPGHHQQGEGLGGGPARSAGAAALLRSGAVVAQRGGVEHAGFARFCGGPAVAGWRCWGRRYCCRWGRWGSSLSFRGDVILLVYLLALARFCTAWAALETGSAFEGWARRGR